MRYSTILLWALAVLISPQAIAAPQKPLIIAGGQTKQLQAGDVLTLNAPTTSAASINLPHGTAPTSAANGDCWTTISGLFCRINGVTAATSGTNTGDQTNVTGTAGNITGIAALANGGTGTASATASAANLQYLSGASSAVAQSYQTKFAQTKDVSDFGCDATGATDAATCLNNALASFGSLGGVLHIRGKFLVTSASLTVPTMVSLVGDCIGVGMIGTSSTPDYSTRTCGNIALSASYSINLNTSATLRGVQVYRSGMTFPATDASAFAGYAVAAVGNDVTIENCMILGFYQGINENGYARMRVRNCDLDNLNGIEINGSFDLNWIDQNENYPFSTLNNGQPASTLTRNGNAIWLHDGADWARVTNNFSYGYYRGILLQAVNSVMLIGNGCDNQPPPYYTGSVGVYVSGDVKDLQIIGQEASANQGAGIYINVTAGDAVYIAGYTVWGGSTYGVDIESGDVIINGGTFGGLNAIANGVYYNETTPGRVLVTGARFDHITGAGLLISQPTTLFNQANNIFTANVTANQNLSANPTFPTIASAATLTIPGSGDIFTVTGTTAVTSINQSIVGRRVTLLFTGAVAVTSSTGSTSAIRLAGNTNLTTAANTTLTVVHNGTQWVEVSRSL